MNGRSAMTPLGALARGVAAGAFGTAAMDAFLYTRYRLEGGAAPFRRWESSTDIPGWDVAPAPAQVGRRLLEGVFDRTLEPERAPLINNLTHWGFGMVAAAQYGAVAGSLRRPPRVRDGLAFGATVWAGGYVVLPLAGLYEPIWKYDRATLTKDLAAHLVYGVTTTGGLRLLGRRD
jgi:hypothetical protein